MKLALLYISILFLTACTTAGSKSAKLDEQYSAYIESNELEPLDRVTAFRYWSWSDLSDRFLIISTQANTPYLIKLKSRCYDLRFSQSIKVNNSGATLQPRFDSITVVGSDFPPCFIESIYSIDTNQMNELLTFK